MGNCIRIERLENGFTVEMDDPAIVKANAKRDSNNTTKGPYIPWKDPSRKFTFDSEKKVLAFITKNLDKIIPAAKDDYSSSFDTALKEDTDDDGE